MAHDLVFEDGTPLTDAQANEFFTQQRGKVFTNFPSGPSGTSRNSTMATRTRKLPRNMTTREKLLHRRTVRMLAGEMDGGGMTSFAGLDFATLVDQLTRFIALTDLPVTIPKGQSAERFHDWFESVLGVLENMANEQSQQDDGGVTETVLGLEEGDLPKSLANTLRARKRHQARMLNNRVRRGTVKAVRSKGGGRAAFGPNARR